MSEKPLAPAIEGWHTMAAKPHLIGTQCAACGTYFFPKQTQYCKNPRLRQHRLRRGRAEPHRTGLELHQRLLSAARTLCRARTLRALRHRRCAAGKRADGGTGPGGERVSVDDLKVGMPMELVLDALHETDDDIKVTWKWQPLASKRS